MVSPSSDAISGEAGARGVPRATYRLQFNRNFTFADAARLAPYLDELGVSHLYASPWLKARAGSMHGYDIIDHNAFNPEVGGGEGFDRLSAALDRHGLGHILDFVPNHMSVAHADNQWWLDVLEWGRVSPSAQYFDIDWTPTDPRLRNKVLLPFLGDHYGHVLEAGDLELRFDAQTGTFSVWYYEHRFPIAPRDYATIIRLGAERASASAQLPTLAEHFAAVRVSARASARRVREMRREAAELKSELAELARDPAVREPIESGVKHIAGSPGDPDSFKPLHRLLERQAYRLAYWRVAADEINYRRFFDINDLAGIRMENPELFDAAHRLVARLLAEGRLDGLRLDHVDGLFNPADYCRRLAGLVDRPFHVSVEKILAAHEELRDWPVAGTTGYDFMNQVGGLLVDAAGEAMMTRAYHRFIGRDVDFADLLYQSKRQVIDTKLSSELHVLARDLNRIAERHWNTRDYTLESLTAALRETVACFPVYRTYVDARGADADDRRDIGAAIAAARRRWQGPDEAIFDFVEAALTTDLARRARSGYNRRQVLRFAMKFQQYTSPVTAKGLEDTALYRYNRLTGLNEVGGAPERFGLSVAEFHDANIERAAHWPHAQLATATHDSKRGEDIRARLAVLASMPEAWYRHTRRWAGYNKRHKQTVDDQPAPDANDEYLLYQTLLGAWPPTALDMNSDTAAPDRFVERVQDFMTKAVREAKRHSSWVNRNAAYEQATTNFVARILEPGANPRFLNDCLPLVRDVAEAGVGASLVQLTLKLTCPGVPDIYQGGELWDFNLVDPDNRRPVDFERRRDALSEVRRIDDLDDAERGRELNRLREQWRDGRIKLYVLHKLLMLRRRYPTLFANGIYQPLQVEGPHADRICAFARQHGRRRIVVVVALPTAGADGDWRATVVATGESAPRRDLLTGVAFPSTREWVVGRSFDKLPAAVLEYQ